MNIKDVTNLLLLTNKDPKDIKKFNQNDGNTTLVKLLLLTKKYPDICNMIDIYCKSNLVEINIYNHNKPTYSPLYVAAVLCKKKHQLMLMSILLKYGADINMKPYYGGTILHGLICCNNLNLIKLALNNCANVNLLYDTYLERNKTVLYFAIRRCCLEASKLLLEYDAFSPIHTEKWFSKLESDVKLLNTKN